MAVSPEIAAQLSQAFSHHRAGRLTDAMAIYRRVIAASPFNFDALYLLGVATAQTGDIAGASDLLRRACTVNARHADAQFQYGNTLLDLGRPREAADAYSRAAVAEPRFAEAHHKHGLALSELGAFAEAITAYRRALALKPEPTVFYNLANALMETGARDAAIEAFRRALSLRPNYARAHANLAAALEIRGRPDDRDAIGLHWYRAALLEPDRESSWLGLARSLDSGFSGPNEEGFAEALLRCLTHPSIDPQMAAPAALRRLSHWPPLAAILAGSAPLDLSMLSHPLVLALLENSLIADPAWERMLTACRRQLLTSVGAAPVEICCALARQCFATEYLYAVEPDEAEQVAALRAAIDQQLTRNDSIAPDRLAVLAMYRPLATLGNAAALAARQWRPAVARVVREQVADLAEERRLLGEIPSLTAINDVVSRAVQSQYEENPYPRWHSVSSPGPARPLADVVGELFPHVDFTSLRGDVTNILIAGCGTGRQSLNTAARFAGARVLAIDLSKASLAFALRKSREIGATNIEYAQGDILRLGELDRHFDLIECGGVLHHLREPLAGWRVLTELLRPGGVMRIGLYSALARQAIVDARTFIQAHGYKATPDDIRRCRHEILTLDDQGFARRLKRNPEFYSLSACRDLLFHVQEHRLTLPQIGQMLDQLGLTFLGFDPLDRGAAAAYRARFPDDQTLTSLANWDAFEQDHPDLFVGMYQFWVRKSL